LSAPVSLPEVSAGLWKKLWKALWIQTPNRWFYEVYPIYPQEWVQGVEKTLINTTVMLSGPPRAFAAWMRYSLAC